MVVRNGCLARGVRPRSGEQLQSLLSRGFSVVIRNAEKHDTGLLDLCNAFARELEASTAIQLYATPAGYHSFGWHYDAEEVFVLQTAGTKEYFLRGNTVYPHPVADAMPSDMGYERESGPFLASTLAPGDVLYIPAGMWHMARAIDPALSISVGVFATTGVDLIERIRKGLRRRSLWRQRLPLAGPLREAHLHELRRDLLERLEEPETFRDLVSAPRDSARGTKEREPGNRLEPGSNGGNSRWK
jgi:ribosomal protein L16 Arg81 hydroxylase